MSSVSSEAFLDWYSRGDVSLHHAKPLNDILSWSDMRLEMVHNYIQWVFPLPEESFFADHVPVVDKTIYARFQSDTRLREQLHKAFLRLSKLYGFSLGDNTELVRKFARPEEVTWVRRMDHNHLRITRIIRSLRVLGLPQQAQAFHNAILQVDGDFPGRIGRRSLMYWARAMERPLHIAPDEPDDADDGPAFLREAETDQNSKTGSIPTHESSPEN